MIQTTSTKPERIVWIDTCKGILILLMVWGHITNLSAIHNVDITKMNVIMSLSFFYTCWFMQAFFILTGFTTNFDVENLFFLKKQVKTILIPCLSFSVISRIFSCLLYDEGLFYDIDGHKYFFLFEDYWFLHALFFSKVTLYCLKRNIHSDLLIGFILIFLMAIGFSSIILFVECPNPYHQFNYLHIKDFLVMVFFMWIGTMLRKYNSSSMTIFKVSVIPLLLIIMLYFCLKRMGIDRSYLTPVVVSHYSNIYSMLQMPIYVFYVITGSFLMFYATQLFTHINKLSIISYFGRNSLIIYCSHFCILNIVIDCLCLFLSPNTYPTSFAFMFCCMILTLFFCSLLIRLLSIKPFSYILGKF